MYKLGAFGSVTRLSDGVSIPVDPRNADRREYEAWLAEGNEPLNADPQPARRVLKSVIIRRLHNAGKLAAASAALNADLYARERWYAPDCPAVDFDDSEAVTLLQAIGADVDATMAE